MVQGDSGGAGAAAALTMYSPLSAIVHRDPVTVPLQATVRSALETMEQGRLELVVVTDAERRWPLGVFTLRDLVARVTLPGGDLQQPVAAVMTAGLTTLPLEATAHQAALAMARSGTRLVVVVDDAARLAGVVTQDDLFGLQRAGVGEIGKAIQAAQDLETLRPVGPAIRRLADGLMAQGIGPETLTHFISTLNDLLTIRVIELTADRFDLPPVPTCWIALGSEGRLEQTFATDQDNGLIFEADPADAERVRQGLLPFAREVNRALADCGFALCPGEVMAGNPRWCLTLEEWQRAFGGWIATPQPQALLNASIFFDLRPIHGREALAERLRAWVLAAAARAPLFLRGLAEAALRSRPALGLFRRFAHTPSSEFPRTVDLKARGSGPYVNAARVLALAHQVPHTSTAQRLRALAAVLPLDPHELAAAVDGFHFIHLLRLRSQCRPGAAPGAANRLDPRELGDLDQHILREAFLQALRLQQRVALDFQL